MNISEINLYPDMDNKIVDILSLSNDPSSLYAAASIKHLCDRVEELDKQLATKDTEVARLQQEIRTDRHISASVTLDADSAKLFCNAAELSEAKQENVILRRALEHACTLIWGDIKPDELIQQGGSNTKWIISAYWKNTQA